MSGPDRTVVNLADENSQLRHLVKALRAEAIDAIERLGETTAQLEQECRQNAILRDRLRALESGRE